MSRFGPARLLLVSWLLFVSESTSEDEQRIRELRIEMVKLQILSGLRLSGPPEPQGGAADEASGEAVRLLLREDEDDPRPTMHTQRLVVSTTGDGVACTGTNGTACRLFRFEFGPSLNGSVLDLWVYRDGVSSRGVFSVALTLDDGYGGLTESFHYFDVRQAEWNKLRLTSSLALPDSWDNGTAEVHIIGLDAEHRGARRPYLMASFLPPPIMGRHRRDVDTCEPSESCCLRPLRLSFAEIGFNFIVYPQALEANMCVGRCRTDQGALRTHYERALSTTLEKNASLGDALGECWSPCCKPRQLKEVRVIYKDAENLHHDQFIPELSVESCACS